MDQTMMKDVTSSSVAWKTAKNDSATVSLKSTWKPTFEWKQERLRDWRLESGVRSYFLYSAIIALIS